MTVIALPVYKLNDIPEALRQFANRLEAGEYKIDRIVLAIEYSDGTCGYAAFGQEPFSKAYAVGILHGAIDGVLHPDSG